MNTLIPTDIEAVVRSALAEDIGSGDITAGLVPAKKKVTARIISREGGVLCGAPWVTEVFSQLDDSIVIHWQLEDSDSFEPEQIIAELTGPARAIMTGERTSAIVIRNSELYARCGRKDYPYSNRIIGYPQNSTGTANCSEICRQNWWGSQSSYGVI